MKNINFLQFQTDLEAMPWHIVYYIDNSDEKVKFLSECILLLFNTHAPVKTFKRNRNYKYCPWITDNIRLLQKLRDKALKKFKSTKNPDNYAYYKQLRNYTTLAVRIEKQTYLRHKFNNCKTKEKWSELQKLNIINNKQATIPQHLSNVDDINQFFISTVTNSNPPKDDRLNFYKNNLKLHFNYYVQLNKVHENEVLEIICNIKSQAYGSDKLNITLIHMCSPYIIPYLTHVFNECISQSYFPQA